MSKITVGEPRPETAEEARLRELFNSLEKENIPSLEKGARQIITLVSAFYGIIFGVLSFGRDDVGATLHLRPILIAGGTAIFAMLIAIIAALVVVLPLWRYAADERLPAEQRTAYQRLLARKVWGLRIATIAFGAGIAAFAWLIGSMLWYR